MDKIFEIFENHFYLDDKTETSAEASEVKIYERIKAFDKMVDVKPSFNRAIELFKKALTTEQLNLIDIELKFEEFGDDDDHDTEIYYHEIKIIKK